MEKALLLLSGGLDSTVAAWLARESTQPVLALTVDYGQKAARRELAASYLLTQRLGIPYRTIFIPFLREAGAGALVDRTAEVPKPGAADLDDVGGKARESARAVWVPNRNGAMLAMAATYAEWMDVKHVVVGFNKEEAATFPDNTEAFLEATNHALSFSTSNHVTVLSPTIRMTKAEIVREAIRTDCPIELCWSCYLGGDQPCGTCESCRRFDRAVEAAGARAWIESRRQKRDAR